MDIFLRVTGRCSRKSLTLTQRRASLDSRTAHVDMTPYDLRRFLWSRRVPGSSGDAVVSLSGSVVGTGEQHKVALVG